MSALSPDNRAPDNRRPAGRMERARGWGGPAFLLQGHRPFFFLAGAWAVVAMLIWGAEILGASLLHTRFDPVSWHAHEMLFGYLGAALAGFLLTAVPNWTGRLPVLGWRLAGLVLLWALGRGAVAASAMLPFSVVSAAQLTLPVVLCALTLREILAGRNWKNLPLFALYLLYTLGNALFLSGVAEGRFAAEGMGLRLGLAAVVMLVVLIGGRVIPSFTRNWLVKQGAAACPAPFGRFDRLTLALTAPGLAVWVLLPRLDSLAPGFALIGALHLLRLLRWKGWSCRGEPLIWILHLGYLFVPLGFLALALSGWSSQGASVIGALHFWMAGAIGVMPLAIMSRASLAHGGGALAAPGALRVAYLLVLLAVLLRSLAAYGVLGQGGILLAAMAWALGFALFTWRLWPVWTRPPVQRMASRRPSV